MRFAILLIFLWNTIFLINKMATEGKFGVLDGLTSDGNKPLSKVKLMIDLRLIMANSIGAG